MWKLDTHKNSIKQTKINSNTFTWTCLLDCCIILFNPQWEQRHLGKFPPDLSSCLPTYTTITAGKIFATQVSKPAKFAILYVCLSTNKDHNFPQNFKISLQIQTFLGKELFKFPTISHWHNSIVKIDITRMKYCLILRKDIHCHFWLKSGKEWALITFFKFWLFRFFHWWCHCKKNEQKYITKFHIKFLWSLWWSRDIKFAHWLILAQYTGRQPFSCDHHLVGIVVLCIGHYALDYARRNTSHTSAVRRQHGNHSKHKLSPRLVGTLTSHWWPTLGSCYQEYYNSNANRQGFFSKFLMGGDSKFLVPVGPRTKSDGGDLRKKSDWSRNEIQLFKVLLSLQATLYIATKIVALATKNCNMRPYFHMHSPFATKKISK